MDYGCHNLPGLEIKISSSPTKITYPLVDLLDRLLYVDDRKDDNELTATHSQINTMSTC